MIRANLDKKPREVASMFDTVADKYDLTNTVLTGGIDRWWRRQTVRACAAASGQRVLDIAAGTGVSSEPFAKAGVDVVAADFSLGMLRAGRRTRPHMPYVAADAMNLPFADDSFDVVTMTFGLRNVADTAQAIREFSRVTKPGGRLVICEFSHPVVPGFKQVYEKGVLRVLPAVAKRTASNPESYVYLAESIQAWHDQPSLARLIGQSGWTGVEWKNLTGGIATLHIATKAR